MRDRLAVFAIGASLGIALFWLIQLATAAMNELGPVLSTLIWALAFGVGLVIYDRLAG